MQLRIQTGSLRQLSGWLYCRMKKVGSAPADGSTVTNETVGRAAIVGNGGNVALGAIVGIAGTWVAGWEIGVSGILPDAQPIKVAAQNRLDIKLKRRDFIKYLPRYSLIFSNY